jgi:hypothetical protein
LPFEHEGFNNCEHGRTIRLRSIIVQVVDSQGITIIWGNFFAA